MQSLKIFSATAISASILLSLSCSGPVDEDAAAVERAKKALADRSIQMSTRSFHQSIGLEDLEALKLFFAAGQDANALSEEGATPLTYVRNADVATLLIEHGADVNLASRSGSTPLWSAVDKGLLEVAKLYLAHGADPNTATSEGVTALMRAAASGSADMVNLLLANGVYTDLTDNRRRTPGFYASSAGHNDILRLLIDRANPKSLVAQTESVDFADFGYADRAAFERTWQTDVSLSHTPGEETFLRLSREMNVQPRRGQFLNDALKKNVTFNAGGVSQIQALDTLSEKLGFYPEYKESDSAGKPSEVSAKRLDSRRWPVAFTGPFMVELSRYAWGEPEIELSIYGFGIRGAQVAKSEEDLLYVAEVTDADGKNLITKREKAQPKSPFGKDPQAIAVETTVGLNESILGTTTTVTIRGTITAALLTKTEEIRFETPEIGATSNAGDMQFEIIQLPASGKSQSLAFKVTNAFEDFGPSRYQIRPYDSQGALLPNNGGGYASVMGDDPIISLSVNTVPASVVIELVTKIAKVTFPFEMTNIELASQ